MKILCLGSVNEIDAKILDTYFNIGKKYTLEIIDLFGTDGVESFKKYFQNKGSKATKIISHKFDLRDLNKLESLLSKSGKYDLIYSGRTFEHLYSYKTLIEYPYFFKNKVENIFIVIPDVKLVLDNMNSHNFSLAQIEFFGTDRPGDRHNISLTSNWLVKVFTTEKYFSLEFCENLEIDGKLFYTAIKLKKGGEK